MCIRDSGMAYNSYVILDEKIAVMDTVDANFTHEWLDNLDRILEGRKPDYLIEMCIRDSILPAEGCSIPAIIFIRVDFPAPFSPIRTFTFPFRRSKET